MIKPITLQLPTAAVYLDLADVWIRTPKSSQIDEYRYDPAHLHGADEANAVRGALYVRFTSGGEYVYFGVPIEVFTAFAQAESAGKFLAAEIKGKFEFQKLEVVKR